MRGMTLRLILPLLLMTFFANNGTPIPGIVGATSSTYTPGAGDIGDHLVAVARYMDRTEDTDNALDANDDAPVALAGCIQTSCLDLTTSRCPQRRRR